MTFIPAKQQLEQGQSLTAPNPQAVTAGHRAPWTRLVRCTLTLAPPEGRGAQTFTTSRSQFAPMGTSSTPSFQAPSSSAPVTERTPLRP